MVIPSNLRGKIPDEAAFAIEQLQESVKGLKTGFNSFANALQQAQKSIKSQAANISQSLSILPSADLLSSGTSSGVKTQASIPPTVNNGFAYTSTTTSITWFWDGTNGSMLLQIDWPDGSVTQVPPASLQITGLTPNTAYKFYPYFNVDLNMVLFAQVAGGVGTPPVAYTAVSASAAGIVNADRNVAMSSGSMAASTPNSGTGGGSGGGTGGKGGLQ